MVFERIGSGAECHLGGITLLITKLSSAGQLDLVFLVIVIPVTGHIHGTMKDFSRTKRLVALLAEQCWQACVFPQYRVWNLLMIVEWIQARMEGLGAIQQAKATGRTCGRNAVGVGEVNTTSSQPIHVRSDRLGVAAQKPGPVIHVIDGNEQNIWPVGQAIGKATKTEQQPCGKDAYRQNRLPEFESGPSYTTEIIVSAR